MKHNRVKTQQAAKHNGAKHASKRTKPMRVGGTEKTMKRVAVWVLITSILITSILLVACVQSGQGTGSRQTPGPQPGQEPGGETIPPEDRPARNPESAALQGYGNNRLEEIRYTARYFYEQYKLPVDLDKYETEIGQAITESDSEILKESFFITWLNTAAEIVADDFTVEEKKAFDNLAFDQRKELIDSKIAEYGMDKNQILDLTIEKLDSNTSAAIVKLADTGWRPLSTYLAVVHQDEAELKYFTLERSYGDKGDGSDDPYMFCWVNLLTRGPFYIIDNTKEAFVEAIMFEMQVVSE